MNIYLSLMNYVGFDILIDFYIEVDYKILIELIDCDFIVISLRRSAKSNFEVFFEVFEEIFLYFKK